MSVGYVYDPTCLQHDTGDHPENASRLVAIIGHLRQVGLLERLHPIAPYTATSQDLLRIHTEAHVKHVQHLAENVGWSANPDIVVSSGTFQAALCAAGGAIAATRAVLAGEVQSAWAFVRPPGHHATRNEAMGFCFFNNVAVAAAWALASGQAERVAIVDYDVHHGNGTAEAFDADPHVLLISIHQYPYYPGTGHWREKGTGAAEGTCLNIPLPAHTGDRGYRLAFERLVEPALRHYQPDLILVSAGYDAHWADPLAWMLLSLLTYRFMADSLVGLAQELCRGRLAFVLEGGYQPSVLAHGVATSVSAMLGLPSADPFGPAKEPEYSVESLVDGIARWHHLA